MGSRSKKPINQRLANRRRANFIKRYNANPCNFLPGHILFKLYRHDVSQTRLQRLAEQWIVAHHMEPRGFNEPKIAWPIVA